MDFDRDDSAARLFRSGLNLPDAVAQAGANSTKVVGQLVMERVLAETSSVIDEISFIKDYKSYKLDAIGRLSSKYGISFLSTIHLLSKLRSFSGYCVGEGKGYDFDEDLIRTLYYDYDLSDAQCAEILCVNRKTIQSFREKSGIETAVHNRIQLNHDYFSSIDDERSAYWLGFLYADGTVYDLKPEIKLELKRDDRATIESFASDIGYGGQVRDYEYKTRFGLMETSRVCFSSRKMQSDLFSLGCVSRKTHKLSSPPNGTLSSENVRHFIRGYTDGDGYLSGEKQYATRSIEIVGTHDFLSWVSDVSPISAHRIEPHKSIYRVRWSTARADKMVQWLYTDSSRAMHRKKERAKMFGVTE